MASKRMKRREAKRIKLQRLNGKRLELRTIINDPETDLDEKFAAQAQLEKLPRDSSRVRISNRCALTGRAHGVLRDFGISRIALRESFNVGEVPGLVKASW